MVDQRVSELDDITSPTKDDLLYIVQGGDPKRITVKNFRQVFNVEDYRNPGSSDYVAAQAAFDACAASGKGGIIEIPTDLNIGANTIQYVRQTYGCIIRGASNYGQTTITGAGGYAILDLSGSRNCKIENIYLVGDSGTPPEVGLLLARHNTGGPLVHCGFNNFTNIGTGGKFTKAAVYAIGAEVNVWINPLIYNSCDDANSYSFYTSTENDLSVTPTWGTIPEAADGVTNSNANIIGGAIWHDGALGTALAICGDTHDYNIWGTYITSTYRPIDLLPSSATTTMGGAINFNGIMVEGGTGGHSQLHIGVVNVYRLSLDNVFLNMGGGASDYCIYAENSSQLLYLNTRGVRASYGTGYAASLAILYDSSLDFTNVADGKVIIRTAARGNDWKNFNPAFSGTAYDRGSIRMGLYNAANYEQRLQLGPMPSPGGGSSDHATYAALQYHPSAIDKLPGTADIGLVVSFDGTANAQPGRHIVDKDGNHVPSLWLWTGYRYIPISSGRKEIWATAQPTSGLFQIGDMCWHTDAAVGAPAFWQCTVAGGAHMGAWDSGTPYSTDQWVKASDNKVYKCILGCTNKDPNAGGNPTYWTEMAANEVSWGAGPNLA